MRTRTAWLLWILVSLLPSLTNAAPPANVPAKIPGPDDIKAALKTIPAFAPDGVSNTQDLILITNMVLQ